MADDDEVSPGGSPILRHAKVEPAADEVAHADDERIADHLARVLGGSGNVFHELVSDRLHIDVHMVPPSPTRPFIVLVTSGASARPMHMPAEMEEAAAWAHIELAMLLPPTWKLDQAAFADERNYWPVRLLKTLARLPHDFGTWLGWGHSIPNGDPARPYAPGTSLTGAVVIPPFQLGAEFFELAGEPPLHIFQVLPVTTAEMEHKLRVGLDGLLEHLEAQDDGIYGPIDPQRRSLI